VNSLLQLGKGSPVITEDARESPCQKNRIHMRSRRMQDRQRARLKEGSIVGLVKWFWTPYPMRGLPVGLELENLTVRVTMEIRIGKKVNRLPFTSKANLCLLFRC
jgi:hypothetical protein